MDKVLLVRTVCKEILFNFYLAKVVFEVTQMLILIFSPVHK